MVGLDEISAAIGGMRADIKNLAQQVARLESSQKENTQKADEQRATMHKRIDELVGEFGDLNAEFAGMKGTVADSKQVTDEVKQWKQRGVGALFVAGIAGTAVGGTVAGFVVYYFDALMKLLRAQ